MLKRIKILSLILILLCFALLARLAYIVVQNGPAYTAAAVQQRTKVDPLHAARGVIYDRNMLPMTEGISRLRVAVLPEECEDLELLQSLLGQRIDPAKGAQVFDMPSSASLEQVFSIDGVFAMNIPLRYSQSGVLSHVIGYPSADSGGGFGLENSMDGYLRLSSKGGIAKTTNARNEEIPGFGARMVSGITMSGIVTTIDYHAQVICEDALKQADARGAVVLMEVDSGEILAMASSPNYSQDNIVLHLSGTDGALLNRATANYDPGSIFKIITAAAALEAGEATVNSTFDCRGRVIYNGIPFVCNNQGGHGRINLRKGFAESCNVAFYELGRRLGPYVLTDTARSFGLGSRVLDGALEEAAGNIPVFERYSDAQVANVAIGQGAVQMTPLQAADMVCTVLNDGVRRRPKVVKGIVEDDGISVTSYGDAEDKQVISVGTARLLQDMMVEVVETGTGRMIGASAGGKTGSAETGWIDENGEAKTHGWFAGFFPADEPKYVCVVLIEDGKKGGTSAAPVFDRIAGKIQVASNR